MEQSLSNKSNHSFYSVVFLSFQDLKHFPKKDRRQEKASLFHLKNMCFKKFRTMNS